MLSYSVPSPPPTWLERASELGWEPGAVASPPQLLAATVTAVAAVTIAAGLTVATLSCGRRRRGFKRVGAEDDEDEDGVERDDQLEYF